jgi:hypothetical protein
VLDQGNERRRHLERAHCRSNALLDRAWAKPTLLLAGDDEAPPIEISVEERRARACG